MEMTVIVGAALLLGCVLVGGLALRRLRLLRAGGVTVSLRRVRGSADRPPRGWNLGVGRYRADEFVWYRVFSLGSRENAVLRRQELEILDRRPSWSAEESVLPADATVLRCRDDRHTVELAMAPDVLTGFLSWLEATPPSRYGFRQAS
jgi:hypothetical protein